MRIALIAAAWLVASAAAAEDAPAAGAPAAVQAPQPHVIHLYGGLRPTGAPATLAGSGALERGGAILNVPVRHAFTGRLRREIPKRILIDAIPVGSPAYAVPMASSSGAPNLVWCVPQPGKEADVSWCYLEGATGTYVAFSNSLYPKRLQSDVGSMPPVIMPEEVDIGIPLSLSFSFQEWAKTGEAVVAVEVTWPKRSASVERLKLAPGPDGVAHLTVFGGDIALSPAGGRRAATVAVIQPPDLGGAKPG